MTEDYIIVDSWNLKDRESLDKDGIELLLIKILSDIDRGIDLNINAHNQKVKKGTMIPESFVSQLLQHLRKDLKDMIVWRFRGEV